MINISIKKRNTFLGHTDSIYTLEPVSEHEFVSAGGDGLVIRWHLSDSDEGEVIAKVPGSVYALKHDPDDNMLYVGQNNEGIHKIDLREQKEVRSVNLGLHQVFDIEVVDGMVWVALQTGELVVLSKDLQVVERRKYADDRIRNIHEHGGEVVVSFSDNRIRKIDKETYEVTNELSSHKNSVFSSKYHPTGKYLASVGRDAHIKIWDSGEGYVLRESIAAHLHTINDIVFRTDGRYFATGSMDKSIKLWDAYNFRLLKVLDKQRYQGHANSVNKLLWMKFDDLLVSCSDDKSIGVWEINFEE